VIPNPQVLFLYDLILTSKLTKGRKSFRGDLQLRTICWILSSNHLEVIANTVANTVARITNSVFVITYLSVWVAYMSDLLISRICQGATLRNTGLSPITVRNIEACRTLGWPIYTGYSPLNKGSSLENQHNRCITQRPNRLDSAAIAPKLCVLV
jgi:hypothetical protein